MYKLLLSLRYFRTRFLTFASLFAIVFGVAMLVIVLSIMGGYLVTLRNIIRGQESHLQVLGPGHFSLVGLDDLEEILERQPNVKAWAPFVERLAVYHNFESFRPCQLKAIDPVEQIGVSDFARFVLRPSELQTVSDRFFDVPEQDAAKDETASTDGATQAGAATRTEAATQAGASTQADKSTPKLSGSIQELVDDIIKSREAYADRQPLSEEEMEGLFSLSWRRELLARVHGGEVPAEEDTPTAALVGIQYLISGEMALGDTITVVTMNPDSSNQFPLSAEFVVTGALKTGDFEQDSATIHVELSYVKNWLPLWDDHLGEYRYQGVRIALENEDLMDATRDELQLAIADRFPAYQVNTWEDLRRNLLRAVRIEKFLVYFLVLILVVFTGSMILLMLLLTVIEKTRDVGVLLSLGATPRGISSIFMLNGLVICVIGTILGLGAGMLFCENINSIHHFIERTTGKTLFNAKVYHMDSIPIAFEPLDIVLSTLPPVIIGFLASLIPAIWAPRRDPIKAIQYE